MNKWLIDRVVSTDAGWAPLAQRLPIGIILVAHGWHRLLAGFGGYGLEVAGQVMGSIVLTPVRPMALMIGGAEFIGGLALLFGLLVRAAAATLAFAMVVTVAYLTVQIGDGIFVRHNRYEYALALLAVALSLLLSGAGRLSLDAAMAARANDRRASRAS